MHAKILFSLLQERCRYTDVAESYSARMRYLFKVGTFHSISCNNLIISQFIAYRLVQKDCLSILSSKSLENPKRVDKELHGFGPLFDEILRILGTESIAADRDAPCGFSISKESQLKGNTAGVESSLHQLQDVCENAEEKLDQINIGNLSALGDNDNAISDGIEFTDVYPIIRKVTEIVRTENGVPPMEERLEKADFNYNEEVVEKVLKNCFKYPHLALRFFNRVKFSKGFRHTTNTFTMMINVAGEAKELSLVEDLAEEMVRSSCNMNVKTWTILLSHYGKSRLISKSLLVFENMRKSGAEPDAIAYRIMLGALCNGGRSDLALEFYKDMVHNEVNLDLGLCKQLLKCFALSGDVTSVYLVGENMKKNSEISEPQVYHLMLKSFCIAGRIRESLELIRDLKNKNVILDAGIFETLVKGLCSKDRITDAMEILEIMKKKNVFDENIYRILISTYLRRNEVAEALSLFEEAKKYGNISVSTYTNLMQHLFWKNEFQKGLELYDEMLEMGLELDCVAITAAAVGYVRKNCISEAWEVFMSMDEKGIKPTSKSYTIFINELCKVCSTDEIIKTLNEMKVRKVNIQDDIFRHVRSHLKKKGETEKLDGVLIDGQCSQPKSVGKSEPDRIVQERLSKYSAGPARFDGNSDMQEIRQILSGSFDWCFIQEKLEKLNFQFSPDLVVEILRSSALNISNALK